MMLSPEREQPGILNAKCGSKLKFAALCGKDSR